MVPANPQYKQLLAVLRNDMGINMVQAQVQVLHEANIGLQQSVQTVEQRVGDLSTDTSTIRAENHARDEENKTLLAQIDSKLDSSTTVQAQLLTLLNNQQQQQNTLKQDQNQLQNLFQQQTAQATAAAQQMQDVMAAMKLSNDAMTKQLQELSLTRITSTAPSTIMLTATQEASSLTTDAHSQTKRSFDEFDAPPVQKKTKAAEVTKPMEVDPACVPLPEEAPEELQGVSQDTNPPPFELEAEPSVLPDPPPLPTLPPTLVPAGDPQLNNQMEDATRGEPP
jgi:FtsZ-binding cell division protein ZapB